MSQIIFPADRISHLLFPRTQVGTLTDSENFLSTQFAPFQLATLWLPEGWNSFADRYKAIRIRFEPWNKYWQVIMLPHFPYIKGDVELWVPFTDYAPRGVSRLEAPYLVTYRYASGVDPRNVDRRILTLIKHFYEIESKRK